MHGVGWRVRLGIRETGLCVPPELEEALHSKLSYRENYYGVLCEERERLAGTGTGPQTPVATPAPPGQPGIHFAATGWPGWTLQLHWRQQLEGQNELAEPVIHRGDRSDWHGVTTNNEGRVTQSEPQYGNGLSGTIPLAGMGSVSLPTSAVCQLNSQ